MGKWINVDELKWQFAWCGGLIITILTVGFALRVVANHVPNVRFEDAEVPEQVHIGQPLLVTLRGEQVPGCIHLVSRALRYKNGHVVTLMDANQPNLADLAEADAYMAKRYPNEQWPPIVAERPTPQSTAAKPFWVAFPIPLPPLYVEVGRAYFTLEYDDHSCGWFWGIMPHRPITVVSGWIDVLPPIDKGLPK